VPDHERQFIRPTLAQLDQRTRDEHEPARQGERVRRRAAHHRHLERPVPVRHARRQPPADGPDQARRLVVVVRAELPADFPGHVAADVELGPEFVLPAPGHRFPEPLALADLRAGEFPEFVKPTGHRRILSTAVRGGSGAFAACRPPLRA